MFLKIISRTTTLANCLIASLSFMGRFVLLNMYNSEVEIQIKITNSFKNELTTCFENIFEMYSII